jgi:hypothetical protein
MQLVNNRLEMAAPFQCVLGEGGCQTSRVNAAFPLAIVVSQIDSSQMKLDDLVREQIPKAYWEFD